MGCYKSFVPDVSATLVNVQKLLMILTINQFLLWQAEASAISSHLDIWYFKNRWAFSPSATHWNGLYFLLIYLLIIHIWSIKQSRSSEIASEKQLTKLDDYWHFFCLYN